MLIERAFLILIDFPQLLRGEASLHDNKFAMSMCSQVLFLGSEEVSNTGVGDGISYWHFTLVSA